MSGRHSKNDDAGALFDAQFAHSARRADAHTVPLQERIAEYVADRREKAQERAAEEKRWDEEERRYWEDQAKP